MKCPLCNGETKAEKALAAGGVVYRKRRCLECRHLFLTEERRPKNA